MCLKFVLHIILDVIKYRKIQSHIIFYRSLSIVPVCTQLEATAKNRVLWMRPV